MKSVYERIRCENVECPERGECCTTVRWCITGHEYYDRTFREWWLLHEGARMYEEDGTYYIQWPMRCRYVSEDGLRCTNYDNRPENCRLYVCKRMAGMNGTGEK